MSAARLEARHELDGTTTIPGPELKQQIAQRLAEHRARRAGARSEAAIAQGEHSVTATRSRASEVAAAVARRYAQSPSFHAVLAAEAARSVQEAEAAAEIANINARAIARAQHELLEQLGDWDSEPTQLQPVHTVPIKAPLPSAQPAAAAAAALILAQQLARKERAEASDATRPAPAFATSARLEAELFSREAAPARAEAPIPTLTEVSRSGPTVRLFDEVTFPTPPPTHAHELDEQESLLLDEEIRFRNDPGFTETCAPEPIPGNLIQFPRQLVASRKARPRHAEGPLRDEPTDPSELRIFEVEADHIALAPSFSTAAASAPEWSSILLPAQPANTFFDPVDSDYIPTLVPQAAPLNRRIMAGLLDLTLTAIGTLTCAAVFVPTASFFSHQPVTAPRLTVIAVSAAAFVFFLALYHLLFFTYSDTTPGMRYARIALCTFSDDNPSRPAMRRRLWAMALSAFPLGLGYLWALLDEDRLGWHDRISRMYQRAY